MNVDAATTQMGEDESRELIAAASPNETAMEAQAIHVNKPKTISFSVKYLMVLLVSTIISFAMKSAVWSSEPVQPFDYQKRAERILKATPLIDGHNDLPFLFRLQLKNQIYNQDISFTTGLGSHTDLKRMMEGRVGGQFWSTFIECPDIVHLDDPNHAVRDTLEQIDVAKRFIAEVPKLILCGTSQCAYRAFKSGHISSMLGVEGLHQVGSAIAVIRQFHELGVRYITITHNCDNAFATAASTVTATGKDSGLSEFGTNAVNEMNRLGMMVDLAHVSHRTMHDVLDVTRAPVIFSHSGCYAIGRSNRNVPDSVLKRLRDNGGVIMIFFARKFIRPDDPDKATLADVVDHIFHAATVAGWDHVGIGSDFDGTAYVANGIDDVSKYPVLIEAVLQRGATDEQVQKLVGKNILRVWRQNEIVAETLNSFWKPVEAVWEGRHTEKFELALPRLHPQL